jgi:hypothetical protein
MSAYITLLTPMTDQECLMAALSDLGFDATKIAVHAIPAGADRQCRDSAATCRRGLQ